MQVSAKLRYLRIAPRKVRLVADLIRRKSAVKAQTILDFAVKKSSHPVLKLLNSAIASAKNDFHLDPENLYISKITVDEGPRYKRWMPRARGSASQILKKTSHITLILDEIESGKEPKATNRPEISGEPEAENKQYSGSAEDVSAVKKEGARDYSKNKRKNIRSGQEFKPKAEKGTTKMFRRKAV